MEQLISKKSWRNWSELLVDNGNLFRFYGIWLHALLLQGSKQKTRENSTVCSLQEAIIDGFTDFFLPWKSVVSENALSGLGQCYQYCILPRILQIYHSTSTSVLDAWVCYKVQIPMQSDSRQHFTAGLNCQASELWKYWDHQPPPKGHPKARRKQ